MVQANHHSKSECLASDRPFKKRNHPKTERQNVQNWDGVQPPLYVEKGGKLTDFVFLGSPQFFFNIQEDPQGRSFKPLI